MRLLFATDLHGRTDCFQQLVNLAGQWLPDLMLVGGDALPDADPADPLHSQARFVREDLPGYLQAARRHGPAMRIAAILGNHDWLCSCHALQDLQRQGLLRVLQPDRPFRLAGYTFLGYSCAPPSPYAVKDFERLDFPGQPYLFDGGLVWNTLHNQPEQIDPATYLKGAPTIREDLDRIAPPDTADWVLVAHAPPHDTDLDVLPHAGHVGSQSVRDFILQRQPALSLHGHIHESPGLTGRFWQRIGSTIAVNPGQRNDKMAAVVVDLSPETITLTPLNIERAGPEPIVLPRTLTGRPA